MSEGVCPGIADRVTTVLVVDDDALNRRLLVRALEREGHRTVEAADGREGLHLLQQVEPDVMLLDVEMPELDGYGVLIAMKDLPTVSSTPVVMISGVEDRDAVVRCIELGADDFLPKPADVQILRARVKLISSFLTELPGMLQAMVDARAAEDATTVRRAAHTLSSQAAVFGADDLIRSCRALESAAGGCGVDGVLVENVVAGRTRWKPIYASSSTDRWSDNRRTLSNRLRR